MMSMVQILYVKNILNKKKILSERNVYFKASEFNSGHNFSLFFKKKVDYRQIMNIFEIIKTCINLKLYDFRMDKGRGGANLIKIPIKNLVA